MINVLKIGENETNSFDFGSRFWSSSFDSNVIQVIIQGEPDYIEADREFFNALRTTTDQFDGALRKLAD